MRTGYLLVLEKLNIDQETIDQIISDEGTRQELVECLLYCLNNVDELKEISAVLLQYIAEAKNRDDGGKGSGNFGHAGRPGEIGGSAEGEGMTAEQSVESTAKLNKDLSEAVGKANSTTDKYYAAKEINKNAPVGQSVKVGWVEYRKLFDTDDEKVPCYAKGCGDKAEASLSDVMHLVGYDEWSAEPEFIDHAALESKAREEVDKLRSEGKVTGSDQVRQGEEGLINSKSSKYGEPGNYAIYRTGKISDNGMVFFAATKEGADIYAGLHSEGTTVQYKARLENPLVVEGIVDGECLAKAYEALHPGKKAGGNLTPELWQKLDRQNASGLADSEYDSIIYITNGKPAEIQIPGKTASSMIENHGEYTTTAWSRSGRTIEGAVYDDQFKREPKDYERVDSRNDGNKYENREKTIDTRPEYAKITSKETFNADNKYTNVPYAILDAAGISHEPWMRYSEAWDVCSRVGVTEDCVERDEDGNVISVIPKVGTNGQKPKSIGHDPWKYKNVVYGDTDDNKGHIVSGFSNKARENDHSKRHADDLGIPPEKYPEFVRDFFEKPRTNAMEEIEVDMGDGYKKLARYDYENQIFGIIGSHGEGATCYKYTWQQWEGYIRKYGVLKDEQ